MILGTAEEGLAMALSSTCPSSTTFLGGRAIDRCNPIIRDARRLGKVVQMNTTDTEPPSPPPQPGTDQKFVSGMNNIIHQTEKKKKKAQMISSLKKGKKITSGAECADKMVNKTGSTSKVATDDYEIIVDSPGDSSRYLLTTTNSSSTHEMKSFVYSQRFDPRLAMVEQSSPTSSFSTRVTSSPASAAPNHQVVVLLVSLHCRGCERKMRKHISKMEGVTSFNIDFAAKKLTVAGEVTPLSVLASVSKVKKAQLLTSPAPITSSSTIPSCSDMII
ncbi:hypothetical protein ACET3Z_009430 [Daucus carota]